VSVKVFVWLPVGGRVGHSSMQVGDLTYISLWPGHDGKGFARAAIQNMTMNVKRRPFYGAYETDVETEGNEPIVVELKSLDEAAIHKYWEKVQASGLAYELTEFNCSTIVANALYIGSNLQPSFQPLANIDTYIGLGIDLGKVEAWEPKYILEYAKEIERSRE
jgi:hypothetical protein